MYDDSLGQRKINLYLCVLLRDCDLQKTSGRSTERIQYNYVIYRLHNIYVSTLALETL